MAALLRSVTTPSALRRPVVNIVLAAMFSRSPAILPITSLPKMLWPLLMSIVPEISAPSLALLPAMMLLAMSTTARGGGIDAAAYAGNDPAIVIRVLA